MNKINTSTVPKNIKITNYSILYAKTTNIPDAYECSCKILNNPYIFLIDIYMDSSSNVVAYLLKKFFRGELKDTMLLIFSSIIINILHVAVISKLTAGIINAVQNFAVVDIYFYFK